MRNGVSVCALAMLVCFAGTAAAQNQVSDRVTANAMFGLGQSRAGTSFDTIGSVGIKVHPNVQVVGEVGTLDFKRFISSSEISPQSHRAFRVGGNAMYTYSQPMRVQPFLLTGIGLLRAKTSAGDSRNDPYFNLGLGFDFWFNNWAGVGMQYRSYFVDKGTIHYFNTGLKLGLH